MNIVIKTKEIKEKELFLRHLQSHLKEKGIDSVLIEKNMLILKNKFFNNQSRLNSFAYTKDGNININSFEGNTKINYKYRSYKFPLYICLFFGILTFFEKIPLIIFLLVLVIVFLNSYINYLKQKKYIKKLTNEFIDKK
ncbi:hypothetical protein NHF50_13880 [Flavobacterium sp. NRK F10]|uniref:hypothetical protein n=1 Tax=Flavobacterium sp. NRK F10 TaxID=2954931 RepID=UPI002091C121|nr:hypothetical protein [Flavobacterium sp. NRK F10]MCO6176137.1 hypothetical protein [Flavobacterium sp. NRK F10]